jgi:hypothetical protein
MSMPGKNLESGWGVLRLKPWHLAGVFRSSAEAEKFEGGLGEGYVIKYGDHRVGTQEFSFEQGANESGGPE